MTAPVEAIADGEQHLTPRYWVSYALIVGQLLGEIFDFVIVGFLVGALAGQWHMTYGQGAAIFFAAGLGAMIGALVFGALADRYGRKVAIVGGGILYSAAAGCTAFLPDGSWVLFALLRFLVGFGYGGAGSSQFAMVVEMTPERHRVALSSALAAPAALGVPLASAVVALFFPVLGWRGVAALGFVPLAIAIALAFVLPESARWRAARVDAKEDAPLRAVFADRRRAALVIVTQFCASATLTGVLLWGPMITAQILNLPLAKAAGAFLWVTGAGIAGRLIFIWFAVRFGRRTTGMIMGFGGALFLALAAVSQHWWLGAVPMFLVLLAAGQLFYDGGYANLNPYAAELFGPRIAASAMGVGSAAGGLGKIIGPLSLGLIAGGSELITPAATRDAVLPGFLFLAGCCLIGGVSFWLLGIETAARSFRPDPEADLPVEHHA